MTRTDRDALIARYLAQYAEILLHLLNKEDPHHPGINYYKRLSRLTRMHHAQQGRWLTETETLVIIHEACRTLANQLLIEGCTFGAILPEKLCNTLISIIRQKKGD